MIVRGTIKSELGLGQWQFRLLAPTLNGDRTLVEGRSDPDCRFRLEGPGETREMAIAVFDATGERELGRSRTFIGRDDEVAILEVRLDKASRFDFVSAAIAGALAGEDVDAAGIGEQELEALSKRVGAPLDEVEFALLAERTGDDWDSRSEAFDLLSSRTLLEDHGVAGLGIPRLGTDVGALRERIRAIKPPSSRNRPPRSVPDAPRSARSAAGLRTKQGTNVVDELVRSVDDGSIADHFASISNAAVDFLDRSGSQLENLLASREGVEAAFEMLRQALSKGRGKASSRSAKSIADLLGVRPSELPALARTPADSFDAALKSRRTAKTADAAADKKQNARINAARSRLEARFPAEAFLARLAQKNGAKSLGIDSPSLSKFLANNADFDLERTNIAGWFRDRNLTGEKHLETRRALGQAQRLFRLARDTSTAEQLVAAGFNSARSIAGLSEPTFVDKAAAQGISQSRARDIHRRAEAISARTIALAGEMRALSQPVVPAAVGTIQQGSVAALVKDNPDLATLFGGGDFCSCRWCRKLGGPASYIVDLLDFLSKRTAVDGAGAFADPKSILFARRGDIGSIDLSCENAETELPYVDLVIELLEDLVAPVPAVPFAGPLASGTPSAGLQSAITGANWPLSAAAKLYPPPAPSEPIWSLRDPEAVFHITPSGAGFDIVRTRQTLKRTEELQAAPEYPNPLPYPTLATAVIGFNLPFTLTAVETRAYLAQAGVTRLVLMQTLRRDGVQPPADIEAAAEALGLDDAQRLLISAPGNAARLRSVFQTGTTSAATALKNVTKFLQAAAIDFASLLALLRTNWVNPRDSAPQVAIDPADGSCDLDQKNLTGLSEAASGTLDRMHRLLRLYRHCGWPMVDIDDTIHAPRAGAGALDNAALVALAGVARVAALTGVMVSELLPIWGYMPDRDSDGYPAGGLYARTFLAPRPDGRVTAEFKPDFVIANEGLAPGNPARVLLPALRSELAYSLGVSSDQVDALIALATPLLGADADALTRRSLAEMAAYPALARALAMPLDELLKLSDLSASAPLASPLSTLEFIAKVNLVRNFGLSAEDIRYFIKDEADDIDLRRIGDNAVHAALVKLQSSFLAIEKANRSAYDPDTTFAVNLATLNDQVQVFAENEGRDIIALSEGQDPVGAVTATARLAQFAADHLTDPDLGPLPSIAALEGWRAAIVVALGLGGGSLDNAGVVAARKAFVQAMLDALAADKRRRLRKTTGLTLIANELKVPEAIARTLGSAKLKASLGSGPEARIMIVLASAALADASVTPPATPDPVEATFSTVYEALRLADKVNRFAKTLNLKPEELGALLALTAAGWLEIDAMRCFGLGGVRPFSELERLLSGLALKRARPAAEQPAPDPAIDYFTVLGAATSAGAARDDVLAPFAAWTGNELALLRSLDGWFGFSAAGVAASYSDPAALVRLDAAASLLRTLRIDLTTAADLCAGIAAPASVAALSAGLKTSYDSATWLGVLGRVNDCVRSAKRHALLAYVIATDPRFDNADEVYDYLLLDPSMEPCRNTSRIVAAHSSIQMFIERCRMGTEPGCFADETIDSKWKQYDWMRNFRVYEAAVTVYCDPSEYMEPDLRDNKSPFFKDFETELTQGDIDEDLVENATANFLAKLDEVARLEVVASHFQGDIEATHVLARTYGGDPATHYHRLFVREREWTPWEKVDLEISSDSVLMFSRRGRVSVAWLVFSEEAMRDQEQTVPNNTAGSPVERQWKRWKIQLAVSDYDGRKWSPRRISREALRTAYTQDPLRSKRGFRLTSASPSQLASIVTAPTPEEFLARATSGDTDILLVGFDHGAGTEDGNDDKGMGVEGVIGGFSLSGCSGAPEPFQQGIESVVYFPIFKDSAIRDMRFTEMNLDGGLNDLAVMGPLYSIGAYTEILRNTPDEALKPITHFRVEWPMQMSLIDVLIAILMGSATMNFRKTPFIPLGTFMPFFFQDGERNYLVTPGFYRRTHSRSGAKFEQKTFSDVNRLLIEGMTLLVMLIRLLESTPPADRNKARDDFISGKRVQNWLAELRSMKGMVFHLRFRNFYHPHACFLRTQLSRAGMPGLVSRATQDRVSSFVFEAPAEYDPAPIVLDDYPIEDMDFAREGAFSGLNTETCIDIPWLVAVKLMRAGKHQEARRWFHLVFDPTGASSEPPPAKYWVSKPFRAMTAADYAAQRIEAIIYESASHPGGIGLDDAISSGIAAWRDDPFFPFAIARTRPVEFQKAIVRHYVGNLIAWADKEFRAYTRESVDFAEQLYVQASNIWGPRREVIDPPLEPIPLCFNQIEPLTDLLGNALIGLENLVSTDPSGTTSVPVSLGASLGLPYFCVPPNQALLDQRNLIDQRLFNIRHCRNIDGIEVPLALFAPPIDPRALVRAAAAGLSISDILAGFGAPLPIYRFPVVLQTARAFANEVRTLSASYLSAMRDGDAERLAMLRNSQEQALAKAMLKVKQDAVREAEKQLDILDRQRKTVEARRDFYRMRDFMSPAEIVSMTLNALALVPNAAASVLHFGAAAVHAAPNFQIGASGFGGSPHATITWGSNNISGMMSSLASGLSGVGGLLSSAGGIASTLAGYMRRQEEWTHSADQEDLRIKEIEAQHVAAEIRVEMLKDDLAAQRAQIDHAKATGDFMSSKFTNIELYDWTAGRLGSVHYAAYQLAHDVAKRAERCLRTEIAVDEGFIQPGYWDSSYKGLLAGDLLLQDLNQMEAAYQSLNTRPKELTKTFSLAMIDPLSLEELRSSGSCRFRLHEALFDLDHPGDYLRRIKSILVTLPCIVGPYTSVAARLTMTADRYRKSTAEKAGAQQWQRYQMQSGDDRFVIGAGGIQSISTSTAQNDSGMFELRLGDDRYLPFEYAGADSSWLLEFQSKMPGFDFTTITDVVMEMRYTAKEGGGTFRTLVEDSLAHQVETMMVDATRTGLHVVLDLRRDFPFEWEQLKSTGSASITLGTERLPWFAQLQGATVASTAVAGRFEGNPASVAIKAGGAAINLASPGGAPFVQADFSGIFVPTVGTAATIEVPSVAARATMKDLVIVAKLNLP